MSVTVISLHALYIGSLKTRHPKVIEVYNKIDFAVKAESTSKFKTAFDLYKSAVELLFSIRNGKVYLIICTYLQY